MNLLKRLSLRMRLAIGLASMVMILAAVVFVTIHRVTVNLDQTNRIFDQQMPLLGAVNDLVRGVEASTSALRGWVLLGDPAFRGQRAAAHSDQVTPAVQNIARLLGDANLEATTSIDHLNERIDALRDMQDAIEAVANQPQNIPSRQLFVEQAEPQAEIMASTLGKMISLEKFEPASDVRRQILLALAETQGGVVGATSAIRAYLLSGEPRFADAMDKHWTRAVTRKQELFMLDFAFNDEQKAEWQAFNKAFNAFRALPDQITALRAQEDWNQAQYRMRTELLPAQQAVAELLESWRQDQTQALIVEARGLLEGNGRLLWISWVMLAVGAVLAVVVGTSVNYSVLCSIRQLADTIRNVQEKGALYQRATAETKDEIGLAAKAFNSLMASWQQMVLSVNAFVDQLVSLGEEARTANQSTLINMNEQRARTRSISDSLQQLQLTVQQVADHVADNANATQQADHEAHESMAVVTETRRAVKALSEGMGEATSEVARLAEDSQRIGEVLRVVQEIADQTNLLALNAAIEAARAGEMGRGFAVVADEVRSLARRTQESVTSVSETVSDIQTRVAAVVDALERGRSRMVETDERSAHVEQALATILASFATAKQTNAHIVEGVKRKQQASLDINASAAEINDFADQTVLLAEQSAATTQQLAELSSSLHLLFAEFQVEDGATAQVASAQPDLKALSKGASAEADDKVELF